jgi:hypothetical protein
MRKTFTLILVFIIVVKFAMYAQEPLVHQKKVFRGEGNKLFINKELPVYIRIATSPDDNAENWLLYSETSKPYTNPLYLDAEGWNSLRTPSAVNPETKKLVNPLQDVVFEIYTDGIAPVSQHNFNGSKAYMSKGITFYGMEVSFELTAGDENSGIENTYYSVNKSPWSKYDNPLKIGEEGEYDIQYYSVDNVGNAEKAKSVSFFVDLKAPVTQHSVEGINRNNVIAKDAKIILQAEDNLSGVSRIFYSVDGGTFVAYTKPIPVSVLKDGEAQLSYYAVDNVGNKEEAKSIGTFSSSQAGNESGQNVVFDFYIDREPPVVELNIDGDQHAANNTLFISDRSKVRLDADDDKSGVQSVFYSYNAFLVKEEYNGPFTPAMTGAIKFSYNAVDYVENLSQAKTRAMFLDTTTPLSQIKFEGPRFINRDTLFISEKTSIILDAKDTGSGLQGIKYRLNSDEQSEYEAPFSIEKQGIHQITYFAVDNVNNIENTKTQILYVDNAPPVIHYHFSVEQIGEKVLRDEKYSIYPSNAKLYIAATDNLSGGEKLEYSVNGATKKNIIPIEKLVPGNYEVEIFANDALGNQSTRLIRFAIEK